MIDLKTEGCSYDANKLVWRTHFIRKTKRHEAELVLHMRKWCAELCAEAIEITAKWWKTGPQKYEPRLEHRCEILEICEINADISLEISAWEIEIRCEIRCENDRKMIENHISCKKLIRHLHRKCEILLVVPN